MIREYTQDIWHASTIDISDTGDFFFKEGKKFIPPGGELSVAPTRLWVTCSSKPGVGGIFFFLWSFYASCYLSLGFSSKVS